MIRHNTSGPDQSELFRSVRRFAQRNIRFIRASAFVFLYGAWVSVFRLVVLTMITYFLSSSSPIGDSGASQARFDEISDAFSANMIPLMGLCATLFVLLIRSFNPLTTTTTHEIIHPERLEHRFLPGFMHGAVLASGMILAFLLSGLYQYIGFFFQFEESLLSVFSIAARLGGVVLLVYSEEFLFRHKIVRHLRGEKLPTRGSDLIVAVAAGTLYCAIKWMQFDLGWMQTLTLLLLSVSLALRTFIDDDFGRGAGFFTALLVVFHPLLSLPIFGDDFTGVVLLKPQPEMEQISRIFTGGLGGPLSSLALQLLLVLDILKGTLRYSEVLEERRLRATS